MEMGVICVQGRFEKNEDGEKRNEGENEGANGDSIWLGIAL